MKVICFGDSNTYGYDPRSYFGGRYHLCWVDILSDKTGWEIINMGENGREIPKADVSFPGDADLLIVMLGTNDLLQYIEPEEISGRMASFLSTAGLKPEKVLLIAPPPMTLGSWVSEREMIANSITIAHHYRILANRLGVHFLDAGEWNIPMAFDGVHFTESGHEAFAEGLLKEMIKWNE